VALATCRLAVGTWRRLVALELPVASDLRQLLQINLNAIEGEAKDLHLVAELLMHQLPSVDLVEVVQCTPPLLPAGGVSRLMPSSSADLIRHAFSTTDEEMRRA
jgi:hypothetical protein